MPYKRTGKPNGRPVGSTVPLQKHPCRNVLGCADALQWFGRLSAQKAWLLLTVFLTATEAEPIPLSEMTQKMRRAFERHREGIGEAIRFTIPQKGNPLSRKIKEHVQPVDSLAKMSRRYVSKSDMGYRHSLAALIYLSVFARGTVAEQEGMVNALVLQLGPDDPQIRQIADSFKTPSLASR
jgi:hypothetical protein